ncbi:MAG TPA: protein kinase [Vicinamibacterales bacterium]|nr:protein kinase [Vicinamibacterales bacterium]
MLTIGSRFGSYEVLSSLGQGGMGEVYRVRDTKLGRDVAIKIVSDGFGHDPERLARFQREAHLLASLNHPHIAAIYGLEESNGSQFLVLELVEGGTLAQRLKSRPLPVPEALSVARQIADALQAAHEKGIIHRDLKPANIAFTVDGQVKVLDFGLAKAVESESMADVANSPTMTLGGTQAGVILGTAPYMAPEQAKGRPADKRSDIWALGCVLYEMLTGKRAFEGEDVSDTLAFVITKEPEWSALPADVPPAIRKVLRRCLEKDRKRRFADIADVRLDIEDALNAVPDATAAVIAPPAGRSNRRLIAIGSLAAAAVIAIAFWSGQRRASPSPPAPVARFLVNVAPAEQLLAAPEDRDTVEGRPSRTSMTWSVDGRSIVFSAAEGDRQQLYIRTIDRLVATPLPGTQGGAIPFVSPDGRWVGFWSSGALKKVPIDGSGPATTICETTLLPYGATWGADDAIIFSRGTEGLWRVPATGGTAQAIIKPDLTKGEWKFLSPQLLPGDGAVVFTVTHTGFPTWEDDTEVVVHVFATGERKVLVHGGADGRVLPTGQLLYLRRGTLMAVAFDLEQVAATGGPVALIADVMQSANTPNDAFEGGAGQFSVSATGSLLYAPGGTFPPPERSLAWVDRNGTAEPLPLASRPYASPRLSPDGRRLLVWTQGDRNVWVHDLSRGVTTRLTFEGRNARAIWTPDGTRITYASTVAGAENLFWRPSDGSGTTERLAPSEGYQAPGVWTPDGRTLLFIQENPTTPLDIWTLSLDGDRRPQPFLQTSYDEEYVDLSPDGRWLAYVSNQSGRGEVYVQPYPGPGARQQISLDGGTAPAWSRDGRELFYTTTSSVGGQATLTTMMVVPVQLQPTFTAGTPRRLFQGRYGATANIRAYDVTSDGRRFLMVQQKERPAMRLADMIIVQNWVEELRQKVRPK